MADPTEIIRVELRNLDRVLGVLGETLDHLSADGPKPDLDLLFSIVYYVRVFPDKLHHPKEEQFLFPALRRHRPDLGAVLDELERQHTLGAQSLERLDAAFKIFDRDYPKGLDPLLDAGHSVVRSQREHMGVEEGEVLPAARACLKDDDWKSIQRAFAKNSDPIFGEHIEAGFHALFDRITR